MVKISGSVFTGCIKLKMQRQRMTTLVIYIYSVFMLMIFWGQPNYFVHVTQTGMRPVQLEKKTTMCDRHRVAPCVFDAGWLNWHHKWQWKEGGSNNNKKAMVVNMSTWEGIIPCQEFKVVYHGFVQPLKTNKPLLTWHQEHLLSAFL